MGNLSGIKPNERIIEMLHPNDGKKLGVTVTLMSMDDERYIRTKRYYQDQSLKRQQSGRPFKAEEVEANTDNVVFSAMTGWKWEKNEDGEEATFGPGEGIKPEFTKKNVLEVFKELPWFRRQLDEELGDTINFYTRSN